MSGRTRVILNIVALQAGWFACILGAAWGRPMIGPAFVASYLVVHLLLTPRRFRDVIVIAAAGVIGIACDAALLRLGVISFESGSIAGAIAPIWMIALWVNFSTSLNLTLAFLHGRYLLAMLFGAAGGASAYVGGVGLEALSMPWGVVSGGAAVAVAWGMITPLLIWMAAAADRRLGRSDSDTLVTSEATA